MSLKTAGRVHHQRECAYCHGGIAEQRPVFLVADPNCNIVGPYHAGCAAKLVMRYRNKLNPEDIPGQFQGLIVGPPREETLPW